MAVAVFAAEVVGGAPGVALGAVDGDGVGVVELRAAGARPAFGVSEGHLERGAAVAANSQEASALGRDNAKTLALDALRNSWPSRVNDDELEVARRKRLWAYRLIANPPRHITAAIGEPPADPAGRDTWNRAANVIEHYRREHAPDLGDDSVGLGPRPSGPTARYAWHVCRRELDTLARDLSRRAPAHDRGVDIGPPR